MSKKWLPVILLDLLALLVAAAAVFGQTPTPFQDPAYANWITRKTTLVSIPPLPGWWRYGSQYLPCAYTPYTTWTDPVTGQAGWYDRYDTAAMLQSNQPDGTYGGQGGPNHTDQYYVDKMLQPFMPGDHPPPSWHYPCPVNIDVSSLYLSYPFNAGQTCPTSSYPIYSQKIAGNPVWLESWAAIKPIHDADCNNPQPTFTRTPTSAPVFTPTPTVTPGPSPFTNWVYQAVAEKMMNPCGPSLFCIGDASTTTWQGIVSRGQMSVYLLKAEHGTSYVPPPCVPPGQFTDVPCGH